MKLLKLKIKNFLAIGEAEVVLNDRGLVLIQGDNKDNPSAESNGAGKSSILNAVTYALYGICANGVTGDKVINRKAKKDCIVTIDVQDSECVYSISRHRKSAFGNGASITATYHDGSSVDLTKGTEKENQIVIDQIMGCSAEVFLASIYASQEQMVDLPSLTDKNLKVLIEEAAGVDILTDAYTIALTRVTAAEKAAAAISQRVAMARQGVVTTSDQIVDLEARTAAFENAKPARVAELIEVARQAVTEVKRLGQILADVNLDGMKAELLDLKGRLDGLNGEKEEERRLLALSQAEVSKTSVAERLLSGAVASVAQVEKNITQAEAKVGHDCGECGKTHTKKDISKYVEAQERALGAAKQHLLAVETDLVTQRDSQSVVQKNLAQFRATMSDPSALVARQDVLQKAVRSCEETQQRRVVLTNDAKAVAVQVEAIKAERSPFEEMRANQVRSLEQMKVELAAIEAELAAANEELDVAGSVAKVFGPAGVRAHILDTVTPYLNERTAHYLSTLTDGDTRATWQTLTKSAKGDLKEKFTIDVTSDTGGDSFAALSGGEKRKVRLATAMALQDLVATRATKPISAFFADEIDAALDDAGLQRLMDLLNEKARERGTVFIVSHTDLKDYVPNAMTVTKHNGAAIVTEEIM